MDVAFVLFEPYSLAILLSVKRSLTTSLSFSAGVLQGDTVAPFLFTICLDYVLRISVDKCNDYSLMLELARSRRFPAKKVTDPDYADDLALLPDNSYNGQKLYIAYSRTISSFFWTTY